MKKNFKFVAYLLSATILFSSCIGSFRLTNTLKDWNEGLGNKFVNELVFLAFHIVPVYGATMFIDMIVMNSIEFWQGGVNAAEPGETKIVKNSNGENVQITALENGYNLSNGVTSVNLLFDDAENVWSAEYNNQTTKLMKFMDNNTAQLYIDGDVVDVTLDEQGVNNAYFMMNNYFAMGK